MKKLLLISFFGSFLFGCADDFTLVEAEPLVLGAEKVRIIKKDPDECEYLGEVVGSQGNFLTGGITSNQTLDQGARNELKNKAFKLGADTVALFSDKAGQGSSYQTVNVTYTGNAYRCATVN